jgi:hypothetical protein
MIPRVFTLGSRCITHEAPASSLGCWGRTWRSPNPSVEEVFREGLAHLIRDVFIGIDLVEGAVGKDAGAAAIKAGVHTVDYKLTRSGFGELDQHLAQFARRFLQQFEWVRNIGKKLIFARFPQPARPGSSRGALISCARVHRASGPLGEKLTPVVAVNADDGGPVLIRDLGGSGGVRLRGDRHPQVYLG